MRKLDFQLEADSKEQPAIGLIVLQTDESMEHELKRWLPAHYRLFHTRIVNDQSIDRESLQAMQEKLPFSLSLLPSHTAFDVIVYGCTSASTVIGEAVVESTVQAIFPDACVTNPITAIKAKLRHLGARRIALLTPYVPDVSAALVDHLRSSGFEIPVSASFHEALDHRVARISRQSLLGAAEQLVHGIQVDAVVASCTNLRTFDVIDRAGSLCQCPFVSSNSALAWHVQSLLDGSSDKNNNIAKRHV